MSDVMPTNQTINTTPYMPPVLSPVGSTGPQLGSMAPQLGSMGMGHRIDEVRRRPEAVGSRRPRLTLPAGFLEDLNGSERSARTKSAYISDLNDFLGWLSDRIPEGSKAPALKDLDLGAYQDHLVTERELSPSTINRRIASLRQLFSWFHDKGHLPKDPSRNLKWLAVDRLPPKQLIPDQYKALLVEARRQVNDKSRQSLKIRNSAIVELLLTLGLRVGELSALKVPDVNIKGDIPRLRIRSTRGDQSRDLPIPKDVRIALARWLKVRPKDSGPYLFVSQKRGPLNPATVFRVISGLGKAVGLKLSPQVLRHTAATRLIHEAGADVADVASLLGHRSLEPASRYVMVNQNTLAGRLESLSFD